MIQAMTLLVGAHVRRGNVTLRADQDAISPL